MLTDLDKAVARSGLKVIPLPGWKGNESNGGIDPEGVLVHHTGSPDVADDLADDLRYANWLAFDGRDDLPPPLANLAFSAESIVYLLAAGNANHAGKAKASGPMPAASDGAVIYIGIEAMNSGSQGWDTLGRTEDGEVITQFEGYARLCASLCYHYGWPASHVRAHKETSVTGKWDPGLLDMDAFRARVAAIIKQWEEEDGMPSAEEIARAVLASKIEVKGGDGRDPDKTRKISVEQAIKEIHQRQTKHT